MASALNIFQDLTANKDNIKGAFVLVNFRLAHLLRKSLITFILFFPYFILYRVLIEWFLGVELPWKTNVGASFRIDHGQGLIINDGTVFGRGCTVRNNTTIGNKRLASGSYSRSPIIGNDVDVGANAVIIGPINIGNNVSIGAAAVVVKDVPDNSIVVGNPGRVISKS